MSTGLSERTAGWLRSVLGSTARVHEIAVLPDTSHTNHRLRIQTREGADLELLLRRSTDAELLATDPGTRPPTRWRRSARSSRPTFPSRG